MSKWCKKLSGVLKLHEELNTNVEVVISSLGEKLASDGDDFKTEALVRRNTKSGICIESHQVGYHRVLNL